MFFLLGNPIKYYKNIDGLKWCQKENSKEKVMI